MRFFLILFCLHLSSLFAKEDKVVHLISYDNPPYHANSLPSKGFLSQVVKLAFMLEGYQVEIHFGKLIQGLEKIMSGEVDGIFTLSPQMITKSKMLVSDVIIEKEQVFIKRKDNYFEYEGPLSLKYQRLGLSPSEKLPKDIQAESLHYLYPTQNVKKSLERLIQEDIDLTISDKHYAKALLLENFPSEINTITFMSPPLSSTPLYLAISPQTKQAEEKLAAFKRGFEKLKNRGIFTQLIKKFSMD